VSGQPYERFITENVLKPMGIRRAGLHELDGQFVAGETLRYLSGTLIALPPMLLPMGKATGGWSSSVVDMARFLTNLDGSRGEPVLGEKMRKVKLDPPPEPLKPRPNGTWFGLGWDSVVRTDRSFGFYKEGSYQGMLTFMKRRPTGVCWVLLYNASMEFDPQDMQIGASTLQEVRKLVEGLGTYPDIEIFEEYP
jgi:CubicO group peptidase (beta-lactamase class C family)